MAASQPASSANSRRPIPSRVHARVPLRIDISLMPGAGDGVFVEKPVKDGDLVFSIPEPLISIPGHCKEEVTKTCDNCFAGERTEAETQLVLSNSMKILKFEACNDCGVVYYCCKECQKTAWKHHHKFECKALSQLRLYGLPRIVGRTALGDASFRGVLRLLRLHHADKVSSADWQEILKLRKKFITNPSHKETSFEKLMAEFMRHPDISYFSRTSIRELLSTLRVYMLGIVVPALRSTISFDPRPEDTFVGGYVLDPFAMLVNHSCLPNTWVVYEGKEFRIRAIRDIAAEEELTYGYSVQIDCVKRREELRNFWGFVCGCELCQKEKVAVQLREPFQIRIKELLVHEKPNKVDELLLADKEIFETSCELAIPEDPGCPASWGVFPIGDLHMQVYRGFLQRHDTPNMLKVWLRFFYLVEPNSQPRYSPLHRKNCMRLLILLVHVNPPAGFIPFPARIQKFLTNIWYHLGCKLLRDVEKYFGKDSQSAKFQRCANLVSFGENEIHFLEYPTKREQSIKECGCDFTPISDTEEGQRAKEKFLKDMNVLLEWAEISPLTEEELLWDHMASVS